MCLIPELPEAVRRFNDTIYEADGPIWSSPLYHGTVSGAFKNALDWLNPLGRREPAYLTHKVIGLISVAGGTQGLQAVNTMEFCVRALRGWAVPLVLPITRAARLRRGGQASRRGRKARAACPGSRSGPRRRSGGSCDDV